LNPKHEDCLVFEDAPNGLRAAYTARMQCVFIPQVKIENEYEEKAAVILKSLEEFKPELFGLPAFMEKSKRRMNIG
jgi:pseudouridine-5'-monophosphatase